MDVHFPRIMGHVTETLSILLNLWEGEGTRNQQYKRKSKGN